MIYIQRKNLMNGFQWRLIVHLSTSLHDNWLEAITIFTKETKEASPYDDIIFFFMFLKTPELLSTNLSWKADTILSKGWRTIENEVVSWKEILTKIHEAFLWILLNLMLVLFPFSRRRFFNISPCSFELDNLWNFDLTDPVDLSFDKR